MAQTQPQTKVLETLATSKFKNAAELAAKIGRPLGSPINGKEVGDKFQATLTGKIEIREFQGNKGAYFTTKEGYSIRVNSSFDPKLHVEGAVMNCICRELVTDNRNVKFCAFTD
jgi:hypothetical protein